MSLVGNRAIVRDAPVVVSSGGDVGDYNGFQPASYNGDTSSTTNGAVQVPSDSGRRYRRIAGSWILYGMDNGTPISVAGIGTFTDPGDGIAGSVIAKDTTTGRFWQWNGSAWVPAEEELALLSGVVLPGNDARQYITWTTEQNSGNVVQSANGTKWRFTVDAADDPSHLLLRKRLGTIGDFGDLVAMVSKAVWTMGADAPKASSDDWFAALTLCAHDGTANFTTGVWGGGATQFAPNAGANYALCGSGFQSYDTDATARHYAFSATDVGPATDRNAYTSDPLTGDVAKTFNDISRTRDDNGGSHESFVRAASWEPGVNAIAEGASALSPNVPDTYDECDLIIEIYANVLASDLILDLDFIRAALTEV